MGVYRTIGPLVVLVFFCHGSFKISDLSDFYAVTTDTFIADGEIAYWYVNKANQ